ncbi:MAG: FAD-binding oxidoreductase [Deltaproteobacteria bacterium]|nr:FAD-binding oxidoreductase [Deltaproteobacteria bacterium]
MPADSTDPLAHIPARTDVIRRGDDRIAAYRHDTMLTGDPDVVVRPADTRECAELLAYCHHHHIPVTPAGSRTSMTGSSVADSGVLLSLEQMRGVIDIGQAAGHAVARVRPGTILGELQQQVAAAGFFYPPSPTSRHEAMLGGTVATNATGDNTYRYGTTRRYVRGLRVLLTDGTERELSRPWEQSVVELKNTAGYFLAGTEIDYFIGSEGTLGLITELTLDLLSQPQPQLGLFVFFPSPRAALDLIALADRDGRVRATALEFIDGRALEVMATHPTFPGIPSGAGAALLIYQEYAEESRDPVLNAWFAMLTEADPQMMRLLDHAIVATQPRDVERLHQWRHQIPVVVNERGHALEANGGGKVGTDWWVPIAEMRGMMDYMYERSNALGIPYLAFGHLGNGHPHVNYLTATPNERARAQACVLECCHEAVRRGGGVAGEHGLGKLKRDLLAIQHPPAIIDQMRALKRHYDPHWILGRGNILIPPKISGR